MAPQASTATERRCSDCGLIKPVGQYHSKGFSAKGIPKFQSYCRPCANKRRAVRGFDPEKMKAYYRTSYQRHRSKRLAYADAYRALETTKQRDADKHIRRKYGLTRDQWWEMYRAQEGCCDLCGMDFLPGERICVDHNHATGLVRALLCDPCNIGLGRFLDSVELLQAAISYIERHS